MSWFRIDDKSAFHRKVLKAGNEAWGAICRAGAVSAGEGTDGRVTRETLLAIAPMKVWQRAISAGLVEAVDDDLFQLHDYLQWNESSSEIEARAAKRRQKSQDAAQTRWGARGRLRGTEHPAGTGQATPKDSQKHATSNAQSMLQASAEHAPGSAHGMPQAHTPPCPSPFRSDPREISDPISLPPPPERARAPEAAAAANPAVEAVVGALRERPQLRHLARVAFAQRLAAFCNEHGFTGPWPLDAVVAAIGEADEKVQRAEDVGEPMGAHRAAALVEGCVRTGPRGAAGSSHASRHRQPGLGTYEQTNAEDV